MSYNLPRIGVNCNTRKLHQTYNCANIRCIKHLLMSLPSAIDICGYAALNKSRPGNNSNSNPNIWFVSLGLPCYIRHSGKHDMLQFVPLAVEKISA